MSTPIRPQPQPPAAGKRITAVEAAGKRITAVEAVRAEGDARRSPHARTAP